MMMIIIKLSKKYKQNIVDIGKKTHDDTQSYKPLYTETIITTTNNNNDDNDRNKVNILKIQCS